MWNMKHSIYKVCGDVEVYFIVKEKNVKNIYNYIISYRIRKKTSCPLKMPSKPHKYRVLCEK